ncbi:MAG: DUF6265 family protein [Bacteroidales bacterium]|nr:DUF6265 family protein [Bacteroidales bacterium]
MKQLTLIFILSVLFTQSSCYRSYPEPYANLLQTLEGKWEESPGVGYREVWERSHSGLSGAGFMHSGNSYSQTEKIAIIIDDEKLIYTARVESQNEGRTVQFPLKSFSDSSLVFVNPHHDFPNLIAYEFLSDSLLKIRVEGITDSTMNFSFVLKRH